MLQINKNHCMDTIEFMKEIDDKVVDLIICDLCGVNVRWNRPICALYAQNAVAVTISGL